MIRQQIYHRTGLNRISTAVSHCMQQALKSVTAAESTEVDYCCSKH